MNACGDLDGRIQLLVDGELVGTEKDETLAHIRQCLACQETMEGLHAFSQALRQARLQPASQEFRSRIEGLLAAEQARYIDDGPRDKLIAIPSAGPARRRTASFRFMGVAAALIVAVGILFGITSSRRASRAREFVDVAIAEHQALASGSIPLDVISASPDALRTWFSQRVGFPFRMPNSGIASEDRAKYVLQGGRLVSFEGKRAALLGFKMANETVSILVGSDQQAQAMGGATSYSGGIRFHTTDLDKHHVVTWDTRGLTYVLISEQPMVGRSCAACHEGAPNATSTAALDIQVPVGIAGVDLTSVNGDHGLDQLHNAEAR